MKHTSILLLTVFSCLNMAAYSQVDPIITYYKGSKVTSKDSAETYISFEKQGQLWYGKKYDAATGALKSEGNYRSIDTLRAVGIFKNYKEGILKNTNSYSDQSDLLERTYYFPNGAIQSWIKYVKNGQNEQACWDSLGNAQNICKVEVEAKFKGGTIGWRSYLEKNLDANAAADAGAPEGIYKTTAQFIVGKNGSLSDIKILEAPAACKTCGDELLRILSTSPNWEPALLNGEPVLYQAIQSVSFQVVEVKSSKRKRG